MKFAIILMAAIFSANVAFAGAREDAACLAKICVTDESGTEHCLQEGPHFRIKEGESSYTKRAPAQLQVRPALTRGTWPEWADKQKEIQGCLRGTDWDK